MGVMTEQQPATQGTDELDVQVLFPEARARRRRLRITIGLATMILLAIAVVAIVWSGVFGNPSAHTTDASGSPVIAGNERVTSVRFVETRHVASTAGSLLFDSLPLVKTVVDTTVGSNRPSEITRSYSTSWTAHPTITSPATVPFEKNGMYFLPNSAKRLQICTELTSGAKHCSVTTKRWIEEQPPGSVLGSAQAPQQIRDDPTNLFSELENTIGKLTKVGTSQIGGVATTAYRGSLPAQRAKQFMKSAPVNERPVLMLAVSGNGTAFYGGEHGGQLQSSVVVNFKSVPIEIWVDRQGVVRQIRITEPDIGFSLKKQNHQSRIVPLTVTLDYSNFNKPVTLPAIPVQDVFVVRGKIVSERALSGKDAD